MEANHQSAAATTETPTQSKPSDQESELLIADDQESSTNKNTSTAAAPAVRLYECTFCKKGFTNAQALGGHMNIHRKDRNKAKKPLKDRTHHQQVMLQVPSHFITPSNVFVSQSLSLYKFPCASTSIELPKSQGCASRELKRAATWPTFASSSCGKFIKGEEGLMIKDKEDTEVDLELRLGFNSSTATNDIKTRSFF